MNLTLQKSYRIILPGMLLLLFGICPSISQHLKVMTYNIRYDNPGDGENAWPSRKEYLCKLIKFHSPDIIGTQEGMTHQLVYMDSVLENHKFIGVGRDDGKKAGEYCAVFYNEKILSLISHSSFWLNQFSDSIAKGWDAALPRICTYAKFEHKESKKQFWVFNTHFDHMGVEARKNSAQLILSKIEQLNPANLPVILMGDFNLVPQSEPIKLIITSLFDAKYAACEVDYGPDGSFNGFDYDKKIDERIDYIFVDKKNIKVLKHGILTDSCNQHFPSDHFPVMAEIVIHCNEKQTKEK